MAAATRDNARSQYTRFLETQNVARSRRFIELHFTLHLALKRGDPSSKKKNTAIKLLLCKYCCKNIAVNKNCPAIK
jgi:hypothetical protein